MKRKPRPVGVPVWLKNAADIAVGGMGRVDKFELVARESLDRLLRGGETDRMPLDNMGKIIAFARCLAIEKDAIKSGNELIENAWAVMVIGAQSWREIERRYMEKSIVTLTADERQSMINAFDVAIELMKSSTDTLVYSCWNMVSNQSVLRSFLGFCSKTGEPTLDDGKLNDFFESRNLSW